MHESPQPLAHLDAERKDDDVLAREARTFLLATPTVQLVAELLTKLREADLPWWSPEVLRNIWSASERMGWFAERPDIRQRITTALTGLAPRAARKKAAEFQAALVDAVVDEGDTSVRSFEEAFSPVEMAVYGPIASFWAAFRERFPWNDRRPAHRELVAWLMGALLNDKSFIDDMGRAPVLSAWDVRTAIDNRAWHTHMPVEVRAAIDDARLRREKVDPGEPFHAADDLAIALPETIATHVPLRDLSGVLDVAERAMGLAPSSPVDTPSGTKAEGAGGPSSASPSGASSSVSGASSSVSGASSPPAGPSSLSGASSGPSSFSGASSSGTSSLGMSSSLASAGLALSGASPSVAPPSLASSGASPSVAPSSPASPGGPPAPPPSSKEGRTAPPEAAASGSIEVSLGEGGEGGGRVDRAPPTARGDSLREIAAAAVENLVTGQGGLPTIFDDVEELQSFVEIEPGDEADQTNPKLELPAVDRPRR
jgi:hypothetical protein